MSRSAAGMREISRNGLRIATETLYLSAQFIHGVCYFMQNKVRGLFNCGRYINIFFFKLLYTMLSWTWLLTTGF